MLPETLMKETNSAGQGADGAHRYGRTFGYTLDWTDGRWFLLFNAAGTEQRFTPDGVLKNPVVFVDGTAASPDGIAHPSGIRFEQNRIIVDPYTAVIFRSE